MNLPDTISPEQLAEHMGWSPRRVRTLARSIGACRVSGNRMALTDSDVALILMASKPGVTVADVREWLGKDADEIVAEDAAQGGAFPTGVVYFVKRANEVKIGYTNDLAKRLTNLRTATTEPFTVLLTVPGTLALEAYFHGKFAADHIDREWFRCSDAIIEFAARRKHWR